MCSQTNVPMMCLYGEGVCVWNCIFLTLKARNDYVLTLSMSQSCVYSQPSFIRQELCSAWETYGLKKHGLTRSDYIIMGKVCAGICL